MNRWISDGVEPPSSRYPIRAPGTLIPAENVYPFPIPGLSYRAQYVRAQLIEQATAATYTGWEPDCRGNGSAGTMHPNGRNAALRVHTGGTS